MEANSHCQLEKHCLHVYNDITFVFGRVVLIVVPTLPICICKYVSKTNVFPNIKSSGVSGQAEGRKCCFHNKCLQNCPKKIICLLFALNISYWHNEGVSKENIQFDDKSKQVVF